MIGVSEQYDHLAHGMIDGHRDWHRERTLSRKIELYALTKSTWSIAHEPSTGIVCTMSRTDWATKGHASLTPTPS